MTSLLSLLAAALLVASRAHQALLARPALAEHPAVPAWPFVLATGAGIGLTWAVVSFLPWLAPVLSTGTLIPVL